MGTLTSDPIRRGELTLCQPARGYRFNVDSLILADFAAAQDPGVAEVVIDLGAGCGIIGLLLAVRWPGSKVLLVEIQPELAELAAQNVERNGLDGRVVASCADLRDPGGWSGALNGLGAGRRLIATNPPFFKLGQGRPSLAPQRSVAKHEVSCALPQLLATSQEVLEPGGGLVLIHAMARRAELLDGLQQVGFGAVVLRGVQPLPGRPCGRILVRAIKGAPFILEELEPLLVEREPGTYSAEMRCILNEESCGGREEEMR